jgi:hypothetical protein
LDPALHDSRLTAVVSLVFQISNFKNNFQIELLVLTGGFPHALSRPIAEQFSRAVDSDARAPEFFIGQGNGMRYAEQLRSGRQSAGPRRGTIFST